MTPRGGTAQLSFRVGGLAPHLAERVETTPDASTPAQVAQRDLGRYYELLACGQREIQRAGFAESQMSALCDALNGSLMLWGSEQVGPEPSGYPRMTAESVYGVLHMELSDADRLTQIGEKWGIDVSALLRRLGELSPLAHWALIDAVERWWRDPELNAIPTIELHRKVGLTDGGRVP